MIDRREAERERMLARHAQITMIFSACAAQLATAEALAKQLAEDFPGHAAPREVVAELAAVNDIIQAVLGSDVREQIAAGLEDYLHEGGEPQGEPK